MDKEYFTFVEAAELLRCKPKHVRGLVHDMVLPSIDIARAGSRHKELRVSAAGLKEFAKRRTFCTSVPADGRVAEVRRERAGVSFSSRFLAKHGAGQ